MQTPTNSERTFTSKKKLPKGARTAPPLPPTPGAICGHPWPHWVPTLAACRSPPTIHPHRNRPVLAAAPAPVQWARGSPVHHTASPSMQIRSCGLWRASQWPAAAASWRPCTKWWSPLGTQFSPWRPLPSLLAASRPPLPPPQCSCASPLPLARSPSTPRDARSLFFRGLGGWGCKRGLLVQGSVFH